MMRLAMSFAAWVPSGAFCKLVSTMTVVPLSGS
jgi:hypothetical protein